MGASLLAIAVRQSAAMLNVLPSSRAGSLPQLFQAISRWSRLSELTVDCIESPQPNDAVFVGMPYES
ncbi:hypothetical protein C1890_04790 [Pseudomonas sp. DP16D-R1]|nr:hypothetical protein C1890_04790 [Pseudomonas sp. DP16D-R1]